MKQNLMIAVVAFMLGALAMPCALMAQDEKKPAEEAPMSKPAPNPTLEKLEQKTKALTENLGGEELKHLYFIRESFGGTRAVKIVRRDVSNAVTKCGKANPDMKEALNIRFQSWAAAVDPAVSGKEKEIDAAIAAQTYAKPKDIKDYLKIIEQAAEEANKGLNKNVVTTPDSCKALLESMDRTQDVVSKLIVDMKLAPWPPVPEEGITVEPARIPN